MHAMQRKQVWNLDGSGFRKKKLNSRDNYLCVIITLSLKQGKKKLMGKLNEKNNKKWRSKYAHDKEAHSNKIKWPTSSATADWSKN